ncbi:hypothetical protein ACFL0W_04005 [Nanoarchaeota archaeon]
MKNKKENNFTKKIILSSFILVIAIFILACDKPGIPKITKDSIPLIGGSKSQATQPISYEHLKSTEGIVLSYLPGSPPESIWARTDFQITLQLENKGAYDVTDGITILRIPNTDDMVVKPLGSEKYSINGRSLYDTVGGRELQMFEIENSVNVAAGTQEKAIVQAKTCYNYKTTATADLCLAAVSGSTAVNKEQQSCQPTEQVTLTGQGGPVGISWIKQSIIPLSADISMLQFTLKIANLDAKKGEVRSYEKDLDRDKCLKTSQKKITLEEFSFGGYSFTNKNGKIEGDITCQPSEILLVKEERDTRSKTAELKNIVSCTAKVSNIAPYISPLKIVLSYGYESVATAKEVKISGMVGSIEGPCPRENCFKPGSGVCGVYGGENKFGKCETSGEVCCINQVPICMVQYSLSCKSPGECPIIGGEEKYMKNACPGNLHCC